MTRLKTLEWLAEFVMCTEDSIPIGWQQRLIRALLAKDPKVQGAKIEAVNMKKTKTA